MWRVVSQMTDPNAVTLDVATPRDAAVLTNLLELYSHDLSDLFGLEVGAGGRFGYAKLPLYWSEPARRFAFLIRRGGALAGFALATRGSPVADDPAVFDVAEFFVVRRHRGAGVGQTAAGLLWDRFGAPWTVRVAEVNRAGYQFWSSVVARYTAGAFTETTRPDSPQAWRVFAFDSAAGRPGSG
jgi:predicted acetyltransferase